MRKVSVILTGINKKQESLKNTDINYKIEVKDLQFNKFSITNASFQNIVCANDEWGKFRRKHLNKRCRKLIKTTTIS